MGTTCYMAKFQDPERTTSPEERGKRVRYVRDHLLNLSRAEFCKHSDISNQSLKAWELAWGGGLTESGAKKFARQAEKLGVHCSPPWLLHGIGTQPAPANSKKNQHSSQEDEQIAKELLAFRETPNTIDTTVTDDAMKPLLSPGDYVGGILQNTDQSVSHPCIIIDTNDNLYTRILELGTEPNKFNLISLNEKTAQAKEIRNIEIKQAAPIIWIRKRLR